MFPEPTVQRGGTYEVPLGDFTEVADQKIVPVYILQYGLKAVGKRRSNIAGVLLFAQHRQYLQKHRSLIQLTALCISQFPQPRK